MARDRIQKNERSRQTRGVTEKKLLRLFSAVVPELAEILERAKLSTEERSELIHGLNMIHRINGGIRGPGWPCVQLSDFLHQKASCYRDQMALLHNLGIETTGQFFKLSLDVIAGVFQENGIRLPIVLEVLHAEFNRKRGSILRKVFLPGEYPRFPLIPESERED